MKTKAIETALVELLNAIPGGALENMCDELDELADQIESVESFRSAGVLTNDRGLVISLSNGSEFQITIVQSELARSDEEDDEEEEDDS